MNANAISSCSSKELTNLEMHILNVQKAAELSNELCKKGLEFGHNNYDDLAAYYYNLLSDLEKKELGY